MAFFNTVTSVVINATSDGDNEIVAAQGEGKKIRVYGYTFTVTAAGTAQWKSGASTALSGAMEFVDGGGASPALSAHPDLFHFETAANEALVLAAGTGVDAKGHVTIAVLNA